ncbi:VacJ family lipoprotein [Ferrovum sp. PN-J185]|uniref:MlaA family lipoprotein n=1 Tax=Ferrovum sp. PN-J185 TaxID=1356306 RepID=UPI001E3FD212|nr:VacJ family lipoprotein [Ferrovum sp. PN-J185]MCC6067611.1 VacJ family lipoprotein [Ferrovum sp. PN-J185]MDE1892029.1 VacJ family lipoprotein [Betaproteobacteria bacterium]MDE2056522.1 VacJ family lipoprotein [Betaproteobacteria bacterium]
MFSTYRYVVYGLCCGLLLLLTSCASIPAGQEDPKDPLQSYNRSMYKFNEGLDSYVIKPVAQGYKTVTPGFFRDGISNFFSNIGDITVFLNDLLQGKITQGGQDAGRFVVNTTVGLLGFIDVAKHIGLEKHNEDFGQTLAVWGWDESPYLVLPILGPSTIRDGLGLAAAYPFSFYANSHANNTHLTEIGALEVVNTRAGLLAATNVLQTAALDPYTFMRDAYLQRRKNLIYDGHPPHNKEDDE